ASKTSRLSDAGRIRGPSAFNSALQQAVAAVASGKPYAQYTTQMTTELRNANLGVAAQVVGPIDQAAKKKPNAAFGDAAASCAATGRTADRLKTRPSP